MRIVVCEDEPFYQTAIAEAIERWQSASGHTDVELSVFSSSEDVLEAIEHEAEIDLLFVDIQIPGEMSGIDLARRIREACLDMTIVFCTNYNEYVFDGYTVNALRYLKKPVSQEDINYCCSYVYNILKSAALRRACAICFSIQRSATSRFASTPGWRISRAACQGACSFSATAATS